MRRPSQRAVERRYRWQLMLVTGAYTLGMLFVWPLAKASPLLWVKLALACVLVLPMLAAIGLMARRIAASDEFEQRLHLIGLGVAAAVVAVLSLFGGFLAALDAVPLGGSVLIWVFPLLMASYGFGRAWVARHRYGGDGACEDSDFPMHQRLAFIAALMLLVAGVIVWRGRLDPFDVGLFVGMAVVAAVMAWVHWRRTRTHAGADLDRPSRGG